MSADEVMDQLDQARELRRLKAINADMLEALRRLLAFPLALEPHSGESDGDLEVAIGHAADVIARATNAS